MKIDNFIGTSLQNMANVTSAIDESIDNNDNDRKNSARLYFLLVALEIIGL